MLLFLRVDINIVAGVVTTVVLTIAVKDFDRSVRLNRLFCQLLVAILLALILETLTCVTNFSAGLQSVPLSLALNTLLFLDAPLIILLWFLFVSAWVFPDRRHGPREKALLALPLLLHALSLLANLKYGGYFYISPEDIYYRGTYFGLSYLAPYFYMIVSAAFLAWKRKELPKGDMAPFVLFLATCSVGSLLQGLFYGILLTWSTMAFSILFLFIFMQQKQMRYDMLTGAWSKETVQRYIRQHIQRDKRAIFGVVFIDLDNFKSINDTYGHMEGDLALRNTVELIKNSLRKTDIVARFGGDEFILIVEKTYDKEILTIIEKITKTFENYNRTSDKPYALEYSFGFAVFDSQKHDIGEFLKHVDEMMYTNKLNKRQTRTL